ncbi:type II toxin-antitoxin system RelE/ParE family toxin [Acinetobacter baylyi]
MGSCAAPSAKGDDKFITTDYLQQCPQEKVLAALVVLQQQGPSLGRPLVDTVYESKFTNMKELRVQHRGRSLRAFFAFDPLRQAIVLCIADKGGKKRFYKDMLDIADEQYQLHLTTLGDKSNG